ncbi:hypothetical protein M409DRAFT_26516 [Zasmidium cellare ATCC 36951]|uniref:Protein YAE1 n=1 Tax=Zasmidium cellare ATCC 36951 TaxID=1080233 RepID=A0A6A6CA18_ZASCE|nr:uncharacterized protein M409DRAFT_26516 [Zasmidium cellare ATCC 36951]KAF2163070.1 hypothetical protein M409DRAFT_26516 [Zasmidium cellare ATCC 36951]
MLRDFPPLGPRVSADEQIFMNTAPVNERPIDHAPIDPLDDVFGSAPSSPTLPAQAGNGGEDAVLSSGAQRAEHSDIPRLRSIHVTNGYREGIAVSKEKHIQAGFDEGYSLGGEIGVKVGWYLGVLEGTSQAVGRLEGDSHGELKDEVQKTYVEAQEALKMEKLLGPEFFGPDGIWLYEVPGQDDEGSELQVTFADVAARHPVLVQWRETVEGIASKVGLKLG